MEHLADADGTLHPVQQAMVDRAPVRARTVEEALFGRPWTEATSRMAQVIMDNAFSPLSDMRASAPYRRTVARNLLLKCFPETSKDAAVTRLVRA